MSDSMEARTLSLAAAAGDEERTLSLAGETPLGRAARARARGRCDSEHPAETPEECIHLAHAAFIAQDTFHARAALDVLDTELARTPGDVDCHLAARFASALVSAPRGASADHAVGKRTPRSVFDSSFFAAIEAELGGSSETLERARRATRIARVEGDRDAIVAAGWHLARTRRLCGFPYLALRILRKLEGVPTRWQPWLAWEKALCGEPIPPQYSTPAAAHVRTLNGMLETHRWAGELPAWPPWARDVERFVAALGGDTESEIAAWLKGEEHAAPYGLGGLSDAPVDEPIAWVTGRETGVRILRRGDAPTEVLTSSSPRVDAAIAELMLRLGHPMASEDFFRVLYGFDYIPERHRSALDVLIHRVRQALPSTAELLREPQLSLRLSEQLTVLDPRTKANAEDALLAAIAERDKASARELADVMGLSVRTVQRSLREMAEAGQCTVSGRGAATHYVVEDTTFTNPTGFEL